MPHRSKGWRSRLGGTGSSDSRTLGRAGLLLRPELIAVLRNRSLRGIRALLHRFAIRSGEAAQRRSELPKEQAPKALACLPFVRSSSVRPPPRASPD